MRDGMEAKMLDSEAWWSVTSWAAGSLHYVDKSQCNVGRREQDCGFEWSPHCNARSGWQLLWKSASQIARCATTVGEFQACFEAGAIA